MSETLHEEYRRLTHLILESQERIQRIRREMVADYVKSCPMFTLPCDTELNWWGSPSSIIQVRHDGRLSISEGIHHVPRIQNGRDSKFHKAGSQFKVLASGSLRRRPRAPTISLLSREASIR